MRCAAGQAECDTLAWPDTVGREKLKGEEEGGKGIKHGMDSLGKAMDRGCRLQRQLLGFGPSRRRRCRDRSRQNCSSWPNRIATGFLPWRTGCDLPFFRFHFHDERNHRKRNLQTNKRVFIPTPKLNEFLLLQCWLSSMDQAFVISVDIHVLHPKRILS